MDVREIGYSYDDINSYQLLKSRTWTDGVDGMDAVGFNMLPSGFADRTEYPDWFLEQNEKAEPDYRVKTGDHDLGESSCYVVLGKGGKIVFNSKVITYDSDQLSHWYGYWSSCPLREELICCGSVMGKGEDPQTGGAGRRAEARLLFMTARSTYGV